MTDEEIGLAVASKLTGEFYVGQKLRHIPRNNFGWVVRIENGFVSMLRQDRTDELRYPQHQMDLFWESP